MYKIITFIFIFFSLYTKAQLFTGSGGAIRNDGVDTYFTIPVSGLSQSKLDTALGLKDICLNIAHPAVQELFIYLQSPDGIIVELTEGFSCSGSGYTNTCFDSQSNSSITLGSTPYTGTYRPTGYLGRVNNQQNGNGMWTLIVHDYLAFVNAGNLLSWSLTFGSAAPAAVSFSSSNLPIVIINTNNQTISDSKILIGMGIIENGSARNNITDTWNNYNNHAMIHIRGSSSRNFEKKSFSIETTDASGAQINGSVLGMPSEHDWDLVPGYQDKSLLRIPLTYDLFRKMGHYSSRYKMVELVLNNEYHGVYVFAEKLKRDSNRIDVSKLDVTDNISPDITGGYIFEIDRSDAAGWYSFLPGNSTNSAHFYYQYVYPKDTDITSAQKNYIQGFMNDFETMMNSGSYADPVNGYPKYIDTQSFIDFFIINELSKNVDAYRLSTYLYKDRITKGGKLHIGPVWDYDLAWHNCNYGDSYNVAGWEYLVGDTVNPPPTWWGRFLADSNFVNALNCRWQELRQGILSNNSLYAYIDSSTNVLNEAQQRNFIEWPILGAYIYPNPQNQLNATYQTEITDLKNWINNRTAWLDANMPGVCRTLGVKENKSGGNILQTYPNPFTDDFTIVFSINENATVKLDVLNIQGEEFTSIVNETKVPGTYQQSITQKLAAGIYYIRLSVNNQMSYQKLIKIQ